jgi:hypothetical protein
LEAVVLNLCSNVFYDITDEAGLRSVMGISSQPNLKPLSVIPVGNPFSGSNTKPEIPDIDGPTSGKVGTEYIYTFNSVDADDDDVFYYIKWGDGHVEIWDGPYNSGVDADIKHTFIREGTFKIEAKAKDFYGAESEWAEFTVTMPRNKIVNRPILNLLQNFLQSHHNLFPIIQKILQQLGFGL